MDSLTATLPPGEAISLSALVVALGIGFVLSIVLSWHFERFGSTLSNRSEFSAVFPFIVLTTTLIITVVKSSLALSLGLVGALSIVRFRTPIKEPEELAYLFIAIAIGLGLGADQTVATAVAALIILTAVGALRWARLGKDQKNLYLSVDWTPPEGDGFSLESLDAVVSRNVAMGDLRRVDKRDSTLEATYLIDVADVAAISTLVQDLETSFPGINVTFIDQNRLPSV